MLKKKIFTLFIIYLFLGNSEVMGDEAKATKVVSDAAILMDTKSGAALYTKNADQQMNPASLTKIATAIYAIENARLDEVVTVGENAVNVEGTRVYVNKGEKLRLKKLLQGMMVNSGNDAAIAVAEHLDGSLEMFSENINEYLTKVIGTKKTHFTNPHGLFGKDHYTTARDLGLILNHAMNNPEFREIFGLKELSWEVDSWDTKLLSHHRMLKGEIPYLYVTGGKTGFIDQSRQTLATTASHGALDLTVIALGAEFKKDIYADTINLFEYGFSTFKRVQLMSGEVFKHKDLEFDLGLDTYITEPIQAGKRLVNDAGLLSIQDQNGMTLQEIQLRSKEIPKQENAVKSEAIPVPVNWKSIVSDWTYIIVGLVVAFFSLWYLRKRYKNNKGRNHQKIF